MENVEIYIKEMENEIARGKKSVFGGGIVVDATHLLDLLTRIREALPQEIRKANLILQDEENHRRECEKQANQILQEARSRADQLLDEHEIIKKAERRAEAIEERSEQYVSEIDAAFRSESERILRKEEKSLVDALTLIRNCREELKGFSSRIDDED